MTVRVEHIWGTAISLRTSEPVDYQIGDDVFAWFRRVDDLFSTWRDDTEVMRINRGELSLDDASPEVREVLKLAADVSLESRGAFDVNARGFLDPSAIVKGWAIGVAADRLRDAGVNDFAINAGGDVVTGGRPADGERWRVGVQHPFDPTSVAMVLEVSDASVATSGRYELGDHIVDPRTGEPATDTMAVTVVHVDGALADAYATAALVLGQAGPAWLAERGVAAATISNDGIITTTPGLDAYRVS